MFNNPYAQVALTYLRRPFSSWFATITSIFIVCVITATALAEHAELKDSWATQLMYFFCLFIFLAMHIKGQFVNARAHLMPGYHRVHATVAAIAALLIAVVLPTALSWFMGWHCIGFVAVAVLLFGTVLWVIVNDATWIAFALMFGWSAVCITESGPAWFRELLAGHIDSQAVLILVFGILITLLAGIRLVRLNAESLTYDSTLRWNWDWSQKTRQGWNGEGRILPGLRNWIRERQMARLTRLARQASNSWWSRICRWQTEMITGGSLGIWIFGVLIYVQAASWWVLTKSPKPAAVMMGMTAFVLTFLPAIIAVAGVLQWRTFKLSRELLLPVERKNYIRQLGTAAALGHFQFWTGMSIALLLWWLLLGPRPLYLAMFGGILAFSAAFQGFVFGIVVWMARYRSIGRGFFVLFTMLSGVVASMQLASMRRWSEGFPGQLPQEALWTAGVLALLGLLITFDAYRRWLKTDFD
jgi:hypothetical protein